MSKKFVIPLGILFLLVAGYFGYQLFNPYLVSGVELRNVAWDKFENYLDAAEARDIETLEKLSYRISETCKDESLRDDCYGLMDGVLAVGRELERDKFTNILHDEKQIIISTEWEPWEDELLAGYSRNSIYFTRDQFGRPLVLSMSPNQFVYVVKGDLSPEEMNDRLQEKIKDTDQDGLDDEVETCTYSGAPGDCRQTDPLKKDTNGNGWWDSIDRILEDR